MVKGVNMKVSIDISDEAYIRLAEEETKRKLAGSKEWKKKNIVNDAIIAFLPKE